MTKRLTMVLVSLGAVISLGGCMTRYRALHPPGVPYRNVKPAYCPYGDCAAGTWVQKQETKAEKENSAD
jgi:hypothetical protein